LDQQRINHFRTSVSCGEQQTRELSDPRFPDDVPKAMLPPDFETGVHAGQRVRKVHQPTFVVFTSMADSILPGYERYLIHQLREQFDFEGVPIKMVFRDSRAGSPRRSAAEQRRTST